jgi:peptidoglycan/xylan/chitin deacetylase (PgdA/CDA1 family)
MNRILTYHAIEKPAAETGNNLYCVSLDKFKEQMDMLKLRRQPAGSDTIQTHIKLSNKLRRWREQSLKIEITFDDGDITNYAHAYPVLKEKELRAYFFILVGKVGENGYMNWQQIKELRDAGMIIGSHGMTHRILTVLKEKELDYELGESKKILEKELGSEIKNLSIPRGFCNKKVIGKAKKLGYQTIFTSNPADDNSFLLGRIAVKANWDMDYFNNIINSGYPMKDRIEEWLKEAFKGILGATTYDRIRGKLLK